MDKRHSSTILREMFREQLCCLGRIAARHQVSDDAVWELAKGFDLIYQQIRRKIKIIPNKSAPQSFSKHPAPHPGITYLLEKLECEGRNLANEVPRE
jgi:hypothetical protein